MRKVEVILGKAQRRILKVLLDGVLDKAEMKEGTVYFLATIKNGEPVNRAVLVEKE